MYLCICTATISNDQSSMKLQKLPLGLQSFKEIRENDYLYVDKTAYLCALADSGKYHFLSRPRRFGKSLTLTTLKELFLAQEHLFSGLYAEKNWNWNIEHPVIHLQFNSMSYDEIGLEKSLYQAVDTCAESYGIHLEKLGLGVRFEELIIKLSKINQVVVLVDEYDKPIIDYLTKDVIHKAYENRNLLRSFFGVLKPADDYLRFVFITGVSKFSHTGIFSQLNNLTDLTMHPRYATMTGYTQAELTTYFTPYLQQVLPNLKMDETRAWAEIKQWYNGYTWNGADYVYNPFSILHFMDRGSFDNVWFKSGAPKFLIDILKEAHIYRLELSKVNGVTLDSYDLENLTPLVLLFQTGYLTIREKLPFDTYVLDYPNLEVRSSLYQFLLAGFAQKDPITSFPTVDDLKMAFLAGDAEAVVSVINSLFSGIGYDLNFEKTEKFYHAVLYITFRYLGVFIQSEVKTSDGRIDAVVETPDSVWVMEFKLDKSAKEALTQIQDKGYAAPYRASGKTIIEMGINFSSETKRVSEWEVNSVDSKLFS